MKYILIVVISLFLLECGHRTDDYQKKGKQGVKYAQYFEYESCKDYILVKIYNPKEKNRVFQQLILVPDSLTMPDSLPNGLLIRTPIRRVLLCSVVHAGMLEMLHDTTSVVGVCDGKYMQIPFIQNGLQSGVIVDVGNEMQPNIEQLIDLGPDVIMASYVNEIPNDHLERIGVPVIKCLDYIESSPLGRAEWLKLLALLTHRQSLADSLFLQIVQSYQAVCEQVRQVQVRPTVFAETKFGAVWYQPGGNSYVAHLFNDAGAHYLWADDSTTGSISLSLEQVIDRASQADIWLIKNYGLQSYSQLAADNAPYTQFAAYKNRKIYYCNTAQVPYYERSPLRPDELLKDMVKIFHPEIFTQDSLLYYKPLSE